MIRSSGCAKISYIRAKDVDTSRKAREDMLVQPLIPSAKTLVMNLTNEIGE